MARLVVGAISLGVLVLACNALTGASSLGTCEGAACADLPGSSGGASGGSPDLDGSVIITDGSMLPAMCTDGQKACEGQTAALCVGTAWSRTPCSDICLDGACVLWPSCRNAAGTGCAGSASCCETSAVPGGTFNRRNDATAPATVSAFKLESFEVTVGRFRSFVTAGLGTSTTAPTVGAGAHPKIAGSGWQATWNSLLPLDTPALKQVLTGGTWTDAAGANEHKPITNVPWMVAFAFCAADGARLPTQAEWDFAAAGGADQRVYPWSMPPSSTAIGFAQAAYQCGFALPAESCPASVCSVGGASPCVAVTCAAGGGSCSAPPCTGCDMGADVAPVGSLAAGRGRYGHYDLAGNAAELVLDAISEKNGNANVLPTPCLDCASLMPASPFTGGPKSTSVFALGGDWSGAPAAVRTDAYTTMRFGMSSPYVAFRCARD